MTDGKTVAARAAGAREQIEAKDDMAAIRADFQQLRADVAELLQDVVASGRGRASMAKDRVERALEHGVRDATECGKRAVSAAQERVEERPLTSVAVAFGVGVAIGSILLRRR